MPQVEKAYNHMQKTLAKDELRMSKQILLENSTYCDSDIQMFKELYEEDMLENKANAFDVIMEMARIPAAELVESGANSTADYMVKKNDRVYRTPYGYIYLHDYPEDL